MFFKLNLSLVLLYYAEASNEFAKPIFIHIIVLGNTAALKEKLQQWRAVGNTVSDLTGPRIQPQIFCSIDKCVTA